MIMSVIPDDLLNMYKSFNGSTGGCRNKCHCGKEYYNEDGGWDWEDGEIEKLEKSDAINVEYSIGVVQFEGKEYVDVCDCWHDRARHIKGFLDTHTWGIAEYFKLKKADLLERANSFPEINH